MQNVTFKLFHQDEIRRVTVPRPSFPQFLEFVHELFPEIKPEVKVTYVDSDGDKVTVSSEVEWECALDEQKNDKIARFTIESGVSRKKSTTSQPVHVSYYSEEGNEEVRQSKIQYLAGTIPALLEKYFEGPISPKNTPEWLKSAVKFLPQQHDEFDLDINVRELFNVLHQKAFDLLGVNNHESTVKAKFIFLDCLTLFPENIFGLYNLACAESLLNETSSALNHLKKAVRSGYTNWRHMQTDTDLKNLHGTAEFKELLNTLKQTVTSQEEAKEKKSEEQAKAKVEVEAEKEKAKFDAEKVAQEHDERTKKRAIELIQLAEQRRLKLEEEAKERAAQAVEQAMREHEEALKKRNEAEQQAQEQKRKEEEAKVATISQLRTKWASSVQQLTGMGFVMDLDNLQKLERVQGSVEAFFDA